MGRRLLSSTALCVVIVSAVWGGSVSAQLKVGALVSFDSGSGTKAQNSLYASLLAGIERANNQSNVLDVEISDLAYDEQSAVSAANSLVANGAKFIIAVANTTTIKRIHDQVSVSSSVPIISAIADDAFLSFALQYPWLTRVISPPSEQAAAIVQLVRQFKENKVSVLYDSDDPKSLELKTAFVREAALGGVTVDSVDVPADEEQIFGNILESQKSYTVHVNFLPEGARQAMMNVANDKDMIGCGYQWIVTGVAIQSSSNLLEKGEAFGFVRASPKSAAHATYLSVYKKVVNDHADPTLFPDSPDILGAYVYDSVLAAAEAAQLLSSSPTGIQCNFAVRSVDFPGASKHIRFGNANDPVVSGTLSLRKATDPDTGIATYSMDSNGVSTLTFKKGELGAIDWGQDALCPEKEEDVINALKAKRGGLWTFLLILTLLFVFTSVGGVGYLHYIDFESSD